MITSKLFASSEVPRRIAAVMEKTLFISKAPFLQSNRAGDRVSLFLLRPQQQIDPFYITLSKTQINHHPKD